MRIKIDRESNWSIGITREDSDARWPDAIVLPRPESWAGHSFRPERMYTRLHEGADSYNLGIGGPLINKDGRPGKVDAGVRWLRRGAYDGAFDWAFDLLDEARRLRGLGPETTGVPW